MALLRRNLRLSSTFICRRKTSYVVVLPEVPTDTAADNSLLRSERLPSFSQLTPEKCWSGIGKLVLEYESSVWDIESRLKESTSEKTFENVILELDKFDVPLNNAWSAIKVLYTVKNNKVTTLLYKKIHERAWKAGVLKFRSIPIFDACKKILESEANLSTAQKRVIRKFILEARLNGIALPPEKKEILTVTLNKLEEKKKEFQKKVTASTNSFSHQIHNYDVVRGFPDRLLKEMAVSKTRIQQGPWEVTLDPYIYKGFLKYCPVYELRLNAWKAYNMRSSNLLSKDFNTSVAIQEIRSIRNEQANLLGYDNFAQMSMETKMAGSVDNVLSMITSLVSEAKKVQMNDLVNLQEFASHSGYEYEIQECDVLYWRRRQKISLFDNELSDVDSYFPFHHVFSKLLNMCSHLFGIEFEKAPVPELSKWHPDVQFYNVLNKDGTYLASFYLDAFQRPGEKLMPSPESAWMLGLRNLSEKNKPLGCLIFNFLPPDNRGNSLLSFQNVFVLFNKFGHALQHLLTTVPYSEASGLTNIEWDAVELCPHFMECWLYLPSVLSTISSHVESKESLSPSAIKALIASKTHMAAYDLCNELYLSHLDIELYSRKDFWYDIMRELWSKYNYFPLDKHNSHLCSFSPIITDVWAAAYYSHIWAWMLAADAFQAFVESEPENVPVIGKRFRDLFLSQGGGCHASKLFRQFRGCDPSPKALLNLLAVS